ncbi:MAG: TIGR04283 family arsenosugar biosynthesis glycosyltransferase [Herpetosiphon sp.]
MLSFSIVLPVVNEAAAIESTLSALRNVAPADEIIIVDGGSHDQTPDLAAGFGRVIKSARGRAQQMNAGAKLATGDVLIFLHADTHLPAGALALIEDACYDRQVIGGAFRLAFDNASLIFRLNAAATNIRSKTGIFMGDQAMWIRRTTFEQLGGFPRVPVMEDIELSKRMRRAGRVALLPATVTTSTRRHQAHGPIKTIMSIWALQLRYYWGTQPERIAAAYRDIR